MLIRLRAIAGWSGPLLFEYNKVTLSRVEAQYSYPVHENLVISHLSSGATGLVFCLSLYIHTPRMRAAVALAILPACGDRSVPGCSWMQKGIEIP